MIKREWKRESGREGFIEEISRDKLRRGRDLKLKEKHSLKYLKSVSRLTETEENPEKEFALRIPVNSDKSLNKNPSDSGRTRVTAVDRQ